MSLTASMDDAYHTLSLNGGPLSMNLEVYLDGQKLKGVTEVTFHAPTTGPITATLKFIVNIDSVTEPQHMRVVLGEPSA